MNAYTSTFLLILIGSIQSVSAQIYADFTLSQNSEVIGSFRVELEHQKAPNAVANFIGLATGQKVWINPETGRLDGDRPYYEGIVFHRLANDFVIQGGDPLGDGTGGPGYVFQDEFDPTLSNLPYTLAMANSGPNTNGSQFFINFVGNTFLDEVHTVFGTVIDDASFPASRAFVDSLNDPTRFTTDDSDRPTDPIVIDSIDFSGPDFASFDVNSPTLRLPTVSAADLDTIYSVPEGATSGTLFLIIQAKQRAEYILNTSPDLVAWSTQSNFVSLRPDDRILVDISFFADGPKGFFEYLQIDYSNAALAPLDIVAEGGELVLETEGGALSIRPNGDDGGTWQFVYANETTPPDSGSITFTQVTDTRLFPLFGESRFGFGSGNLGRFLSLREIEFNFDGQAGPNGTPGIRAVFSFHGENFGWYTGRPLGGISFPFRGKFTYTAAP